MSVHTLIAVGVNIFAIFAIAIALIALALLPWDPSEKNSCGAHHYEEEWSDLSNHRISRGKAGSFSIERQCVQECVHDGCDSTKRKWKSLGRGLELRSAAMEAFDLVERGRYDEHTERNRELEEENMELREWIEELQREEGGDDEE